MQSLNSRLSAIHLLCWVTAPLTRMFPQSKQAGGWDSDGETNKQIWVGYSKMQYFPEQTSRSMGQWQKNKQIWIGSFLNPEKRIYLILLTSAASLAKKARVSPLIGTFFYILLSVKRKKSLEPPEKGLWQSTCTCFLSFDGFFLLKCPTSVCKAGLKAKQKEVRWYLRARLLSFFWAPFLKLKSRTFEERISSENFHVLCAFHSRLPLFRESIGKWGSKLSYASVARSINLYGRFPLKAFNVDWMTHWLGRATTVIKR